jgi:23S rRNA pseudouridine2605 synthase
MTEERLQKVMAAAGVGSRRACEELITQGRVRVNGHQVTELGTKVDPQSAQITVDGKPVQTSRHNVYIKVHKPRGVLSDIGGDTRGRATVAELLPPDTPRVFPVGRLDLNSEGLVLLTDDGALANRLTHPRYEHPKTYYVLVQERPPAAAIQQLRRGVALPDGYKTAPAQVQVVERLPAKLQLAPGPTGGCWLEIILREGKKRQIRHMTAAVDFPTLRLVRWAIGSLTLGDLPAGESKPLERREVSQLRSYVRQPSSNRRGAPKRGGYAQRNQSRRRKRGKS